MRLASTHVAVGIIGAWLAMTTHASAQVPGEVATADWTQDAARGDPSSDQDDADQGREPQPGVTFAAPPLYALDPDQAELTVDLNAVRATGWMLALVGLGAALTGIAAPVITATSHDLRAPHRSSPPTWAAPLAIAGGLGMMSGIVIVSACGPERADEALARRRPDRTLGLAYRGTF